MYHYIKYASGNTYIMSEDFSNDGQMLLKVELCVKIVNSRVAKRVGDAYFPPLNNVGNKFFDVVWKRGNKEYVLGLAALDML